MDSSTDNTIAALARLEEHVRSLEEWQRNQNGAIQRLENKLDHLVADINARLERLLYWLLGVATAVATSVLLQLIKFR